MTLILTFDKDKTTIRRVEMPEHYHNKTMDELREAAAKQNESAGYERFKFIDVPDDYSEIFKFLLGEDKYKTYASFDSVIGDLDEMKRRLEEIRTSFDDTYDEVRWLKDEIQKYKEEQC